MISGLPGCVKFSVPICELSCFNVGLFYLQRDERNASPLSSHSLLVNCPLSEVSTSYKLAIAGFGNICLPHLSQTYFGRVAPEFVGKTVLVSFAVWTNRSTI